jgi:hypothetical protein
MNRLIIIAFATIALTASRFVDQGTWVINAESQLTIQGSTNVNDFSCEIEYCTGTDTLRYFENNATRELRFTHSSMTVPICSFDCGARPISKDFYKTLKAEIYPNLEIVFISLQNPSFRNNSDVKGVVEIRLAGVSKRYNVCYQACVKPNGNLLLKGKHAVNFSDFQLEAPEKFKGLIKVKDVLSVDFKLSLREV